MQHDKNAESGMFCCDAGSHFKSFSRRFIPALITLLMPLSSLLAGEYDCQLRVTPTAYEIDGSSGIAEYSVTKLSPLNRRVV